MEYDSAATELTPVADTFATGVSGIEMMGKNARITFYVDQGGERIVVSKLIVEIDYIPGLLATIMKATWHRLTHIPLLEVAMANRVGRH
jgi:hypothetical protein